jgi:hypothetical protein
MDALAALFNMALADIGSTQQVSGVDDGSKASAQCALWWPVARDLVLRAYPWPFATVTATLARIPPSVFQAPDWTYAFAYPADCLKALDLLSPAGRRASARARIPWTVRAAPVDAAGGTVRYVLTDLGPGAVGAGGACGAGDDWPGWGAGVGGWGLTPGTALPCLRYIARVTDVSVYPPEVAVAMAWQLAACLAMPLALARDLRQTAEAQARAALAAAIALNLNEGRADPPPEADPQHARR